MKDKDYPKVETRITVRMIPGGIPYNLTESEARLLVNRVLGQLNKCKAKK